MLQKIALSLCLMTALCGFASAYAASQPGSSAPAAYAQASSFVSGQDIPAVWWQLFQSPQIDTLLKRALKTHPDIETAQAALRKAQAYTFEHHGFFYLVVTDSVLPESDQLAPNPENDLPQVNSPPEQSGTNLGTGVREEAYYGFRTARLKVGFEPEVFTLKPGEVDLPQDQAGVNQMRLEATNITLASNIVAAAIQEASLKALIEAQLRLISVNQQALEIVRNQLKLGYVTEKEVTQQEMTSALAQQQLAPLQLQLEQTRDLLHILAGPDQDAEDTFSLDGLHLLQDLPSSLQSGLVELRPDVRVAQARLNYTSGQYGVAIEHTMPQFTVTPAWMIRNGGEFFQNSDAAQAVFEGRTLRTKSPAAKHQLAQAALQYRSVVMTALQNVTDILQAIQYDTGELKAAEKSAQTAGKLGDQTREQYQAGSVDFQNLRVVQQNEQFAAIKLIQAQTNRLGETAALFQALGGGWWGDHAADRDLAKHPE